MLRKKCKKLAIRGIISDIVCTGLIEVVRLKITTKGRYGLTIMIELAKRSGEGPLSLKAIADEHHLSVHYLEQLAALLRNAGLITSVRGAYGGYKLAKRAEHIKASHILRALEGPLVLVEGIEHEIPAQQKLWSQMTQAVKQVLDTTTLANLAAYDSANDEEQYMFYI